MRPPIGKGSAGGGQAVGDPSGTGGAAPLEGRAAATPSVGRIGKGLESHPFPCLADLQRQAEGLRAFGGHENAIRQAVA